MGGGGQFHFFGKTHLTALGSLAVFSLILIAIARHPRWNKWTHWINAALAVLLLSNEIIWWLVAINMNMMSLRWGLPLQICDLVIFAVAFSLVRHHQFLWELAYFWGLGGTLQAVLTPDMPFDFPHYYFFKFFISHGGVVVGVLYLAAGCRRPISHRSVWRVWLITTLYGTAILGINGLLGSNYLYLCRKPAHPSILDFLGPWPFYLIGLELFLIASLYFYYFPFVVAQWFQLRRHRRSGCFQ